MYLKLTDGTTTIDLLNGSPFMLEVGKWSPGVSHRVDDKLGGNPFASVVERIPLYAASGVDAATLLAAVETLAGLIDQSWRWKNREPVDPVFIRYSPLSDVAYLEDILIGPPLGEAGVLLPPTMHDDLYQALINDGITLQFIRRNGEWLGDEDSQSASSVANMTISTATMSDDVYLHTPVEIQWYQDIAGDQGYNLYSGFIIISDLASKIKINNAATMSLSASVSGTWTTLDDGKFPYNGSLARFTITVAGISTTTITVVSANVPDGKRVAAIISFRNETTTTSWNLKTYFTIKGGAKILLSETIIDNNYTVPTYVLLGIAEAADGIGGFSFTISCENGIVNDYIDFDSITLVEISAPTSRILEYGGISTGVSFTTSFMNISPDALKSTRPFVGISDASNDRYTANSWNGDAYLLSRGDSVSSLLLLKRLSSFWQANGIAFTMTANRRPGYLVAR